MKAMDLSTQPGEDKLSAVQESTPVRQKKVDRKRRKYPRIKCSFPVSVLTQSGARFTTHTRDISENGLLLEGHQSAGEIPVRAGENLTLVLNSPFLTAERTRNKLTYEVVGVEPGRNGRALLRLTAESGENFELVNPSDYVIPPELELEFLKTRELLNLKLGDRPSRLISISGVEKGVGASTYSWWLASCLARSTESRVLYVDANLRPQGSDTEQENEYGLSELLFRQCSLDDAVIQLGGFCPSIINSSGAGAFFNGDITGPMVREVAETFRNNFDYVIIDSLPVVTSPLSLMLARESDGSLLVVESCKTSKDTAKECVELMREVGCNVLGAVLNKA